MGDTESRDGWIRGDIGRRVREEKTNHQDISIDARREREKKMKEEAPGKKGKKGREKTSEFQNQSKKSRDMKDDKKRTLFSFPLFSLFSCLSLRMTGKKDSGKEERKKVTCRDREKRE